MTDTESTDSPGTKPKTALDDVNMERDQLTAAAIGNLNWLQLSIKNAYGEVKSDRHGFTAMHLAALHGRLQCLKLLVEDFKLSVDLPSHSGWRALHLVLNQKSGSRALDCVRYLIEQGADVNVWSKTKVTPLHQAATEGLHDCVVALVEAGADVHAKNSQGQKPIDLCKIWGHRSCTRYLRNAMWKKEKEDFAKELKKMEKLKNDIQEMEQNAFLKMKEDKEIRRHTMFCDWVDAKGFPERLKKGFPQTEISSNSKQTNDHSKRSTEEQQNKKKSSSSSKPKKHTKIENGAAIQEKKNKSAASKEAKYFPNKKSSKNLSQNWNPSANPLTPPTTEISRTSTVRMGTHADDTFTRDLSSYVYLTKDENGYPKINTVGGKVRTPVPKLPYEVIQRCLFPNTIPPCRVQKPRDFKSTHVFDLPKKQPPLEEKRPVSEIAFHLRQNLDPKYEKKN
ncbi:ankyrin repeat domain-containing protein 53 [Discoglossus pictus]